MTSANLTSTSASASSADLRLLSNIARRTCFSLRRSCAPMFVEVNSRIGRLSGFGSARCAAAAWIQRATSSSSWLSPPTCMAAAIRKALARCSSSICAPSLRPASAFRRRRCLAPSFAALPRTSSSRGGICRGSSSSSGSGPGGTSSSSSKASGESGASSSESRSASSPSASSCSCPAAPSASPMSSKPGSPKASIISGSKPSSRSTAVGARKATPSTATVRFL
mmetsp:Transcript_103667/g.323134  ORF Transcript_103667/g.323134 Transcript_103667/m.323134 type:complete len:224 (-) Transcript_103667:853-1524(-)